MSLKIVLCSIRGNSCRLACTAGAHIGMNHLKEQCPYTAIDLSVYQIQPQPMNTARRKNPIYECWSGAVACKTGDVLNNVVMLY